MAVSPSKNLILSVSDGYNYFDLSRFVESLQKTGFDGHVCVFMGPMTKPDAVKQLTSRGIEVIRFSNVFPFIPHPHPANFKALPSPIHIWNFRHFLYYNYLLEHQQEFEHVLLTDIRDVVFQDDPFAFELGEELNIAMEDVGTTIGNAYPNADWIRNGYGPAKLTQMQDCQVSCAGTTLARMPVMIAYLRTLLNEICTLHDALHCADQAAHNVLLHEGRLGPVRRHQNDNGPILTVGTLHADTQFAFDDQGYVLNQAGRRPCILHQYDRHPGLAARVDKIAYSSLWRLKYLQIKYLTYLRRKYREYQRVQAQKNGRH